MGIVKKFPSKSPRQSREDFKEPVTPTQKKLRWRRPWRTMIVALVFGYILFFSVGQQLQLKQSYAEKSDLMEQKEKLIIEQQYLESEIKLLEQDDTVEKIAREQLGLIKPGEKLLIIRY